MEYLTDLGNICIEEGSLEEASTYFFFVGTYTEEIFGEKHEITLKAKSKI